MSGHPNRCKRLRDGAGNGQTRPRQARRSLGIALAGLLLVVSGAAIAARTVYVGAGPSQVAVVDAATYLVTSTIALPAPAVGLTVNRNGTRLYVANGASLYVIDTTSRALLATVSVGGFETGGADPALNASGTRVYVANASGNAVAVVDATTNAFVTSIAVGQGPGAIAAKPNIRISRCTRLRFTECPWVRSQASIFRLP